MLTEKGIMLSDLGRDFKQAWKLIVVITGSLILIASVVGFMMKPVYRVETTICLPRADNKCIDFVKEQQLPGLTRINYSMGRRTFHLTYSGSTATEAQKLATEQTQAIAANVNALLQSEAIRRHELGQQQAIKKEIQAIKNSLAKNDKNYGQINQRLANLEKRIGDGDKKLRLQKVIINIPKTVPQEPAYPQPFKYIALSCLLGLVLSSVFVLVRTIVRKGD